VYPSLTLRLFAGKAWGIKGANSEVFRGQLVRHYTKPDTIYARLAENKRAFLKVRLEALRSISRPSLAMLTRILADPEAPTKLLSLAAKKYEIELAVRGKGKGSNG
jgi:hypothetical protein